MRRALCAAVSSASEEPLAATASRVDHWILFEYPGAWASDVLGGSLLSAELKEHLRSQLAALPHARLLFVKKPRRRPHASSRVFFGTLEARSRAALRAGARAPRRPARHRRRSGCSPARARRAPVQRRSRGRSSSSARTASGTGAARCTAGRCTTPCGTRRTRIASGSRRTSAATASRETPSCSPTASTTGASAQRTQAASSPRRPPVGSTSTPIAGAAPTRSRCRRPSARFASPKGCWGSTNSSSRDCAGCRRAVAGSFPDAGRGRPRASSRGVAGRRAHVSHLRIDRASALPPVAGLGARRRQPMIRRNPSRTRRRTRTSRPSVSRSPGRSSARNGSSLS